MYAAISEPSKYPVMQYHPLTVSVPAIDANGHTVDIVVEPPYTSSAPRRIGAGDNASFGDGEDGTKLPEVNNDPNPTPIGDATCPLLLFALAYFLFKSVREGSPSDKQLRDSQTPKAKQVV